MTPRKRGFPASLFDMSDMKLLHEETRYEGSVEYTERIVDGFMPSRNPVLYYDLDHWMRIGFYMRLRKIMPRWHALFLICAYYIGTVTVIWGLAESLHRGLSINDLSVLFAFIAVNAILYRHEFMQRNRDLDGYVRRFPVSASDLIERLKKGFDERGYTFEVITIRKRDVDEKPSLLIVSHSDVTLLVVVWDDGEHAILHIGRNPSSDWAEIGALIDLVNGLDLDTPVEREYDYLKHHH